MFIVHHGIIGQKWGIRRYQNPDGTLTEEGKRRYYTHDTKEKIKKFINNDDQKILFITGKSGAGKTTLANEIKEKKPAIQTIHLDYYIDGENVPANKKFDKFLSNKDEKWKTNLGVKNGEYWDFLSDNILEYSKNNKIIVEGVALDDKDVMFYKNRSVMNDNNTIKLNRI